MTTSQDPGLARLDNARWLAALAVVVLHCAAPGVTGQPPGTGDWLAANAYDSAVRWCVPVFVMISGALMLAPQHRTGLRRYYARRASRIVVPLLFWSAFYLGWRILLGWRDDGAPPAAALLDRVAAGAPYYHLWYLYMLAGLYLFAPFVRDWYAQARPRHRKAVVLGVLGIAMADTLHRHLTGGAGGFFLTWFVPYLGYFVAGRMIYEGELRLRRPGLVLAATVAATAAGVARLSSPDGLDLYFYDYFGATVPLMSVAAFQLILRAPGRQRQALPGCIAPLTFGIYLIHPVFIDLAQRSRLYAAARMDGLAVPLAALAVFGLSAAATWLLARHPLTRRLV